LLTGNISKLLNGSLTHICHQERNLQPCLSCKLSFVASSKPTFWAFSNLLFECIQTSKKMKKSPLEAETYVQTDV